MPRPLMKESLSDYTGVMRARYARRPGKMARSALLDEYCQTTQLERKYAIKVLRGQRRKARGGTRRGAPVTYRPEDIAVLKGVWLAAGQPCGKRLSGEMLGLWMNSWQKHHDRLEDAQYQRIVAMSAAQIDRLLAPWRSPERRRRIASSGMAAMQREVAVRCEPWAETTPGALEIDTVALCGGSLSGAIIWALDGTDIHSGWTEVRAVWNRGAYATCEQMSDIEQALPFALRMLDFDNGSEFLNAHFISHFKSHDPAVELSRSRPYHKNDNAHIEQKNYTHVRLLLGDDRFEEFALIAPLNAVFRSWSLWNNLYGAQRRLLRKERQADGKVKRCHEKQASTPCARLLARSDLSAAQRHQLLGLLERHDPITLRAGIERQLSALYALRAQLHKEREATDDALAASCCAPSADSRHGAAARAMAGSPSVRPVASGSRRSLRASPPSRAPHKEALPTSPKTTKHNQPTVSSTVRHRTAS